MDELDPATIKQKAAHAWRAIRGDGCSSVPDWNKRICACCMNHDRHYRTGIHSNGEPITRAEADARLRNCIHRNARTAFGRWILAPAYWIGVRLFGGRFYNSGNVK